MLVRSLIYGLGFDFMRPFQKTPDHISVMFLTEN